MRERSWSRPLESSSIPEEREESLIFLMALVQLGSCSWRNIQNKFPTVSPPNRMKSLKSAIGVADWGALNDMPC